MTMECDRRTGSEQGKEGLVADLRRLLDEQLTAGREGDFKRVERLGERANAVVEAITRCPGPVQTHAEGARDLGKLYGELALLLQAEQADAQSRLRQLRRVKRVLGVYGGKDKSGGKPSTQLG